MKGYVLDAEGKVAGEHFALVYAPRRARDRFAENCVELVESEELARRCADPERSRYAAKVIGPARSSEGLRVFYLVQWLE